MHTEREVGAPLEAVEETSPMKRGLKCTSQGALHTRSRQVEETSPMKRGLKSTELGRARRMFRRLKRLPR